MMNFKKDVVYYFDEMIGTYHYAYAHPMKPLRVAMTDEIVHKYELDRHFDTIVSKKLTQDLEFAQLHNYYATQEYLTTFHSDEYIDLIRTVTP